MLANNEKVNLNNKFNMYEVLYFTITTIVFIATILLITPFVAVYTKDIADTNYIRYTFGYLIVISEYICMIRMPYITLTHAAGHFKETRGGAWIEAISNIVISIILVNKYGLIGVAIGTIVAMTIRTLEFVYHTNKYILNRSIIESINKIKYDNKLSSNPISLNNFCNLSCILLTSYFLYLFYHKYIFKDINLH